MRKFIFIALIIRIDILFGFKLNETQETEDEMEMERRKRAEPALERFYVKNKPPTIDEYFKLFASFDAESNANLKNQELKYDATCGGKDDKKECKFKESKLSCIKEKGGDPDGRCRCWDVEQVGTGKKEFMQFYDKAKKECIFDSIDEKFKKCILLTNKANLNNDNFLKTDSLSDIEPSKCVPTMDKVNVFNSKCVVPDGILKSNNPKFKFRKASDKNTKYYLIGNCHGNRAEDEKRANGSLTTQKTPDGGGGGGSGDGSNGGPTTDSAPNNSFTSGPSGSGGKDKNKTPIDEDVCKYLRRVAIKRTQRDTIPNSWDHSMLDWPQSKIRQLVKDCRAANRINNSIPTIIGSATIPTAP